MDRLCLQVVVFVLVGGFAVGSVPAAQVVDAGTLQVGPAPASRPAAAVPRPVRPSVRPSTAPIDPNAPRPKIRCDEMVYQFPDAWSGDVVEHAYIIHNDGNAPLEILSARASCGCTVTEYDKVIAPGKEGKVTAKLNTTRMAHTVTKTVTVESNDPVTKTITLTIKGTVKPRITVDPLAVNFGTVNEDSKLTQTVKITNNTEDKMKLEPIPLPPGVKSVFVTELTELEAGKTAELKVTATRPFKEGSNNVMLRFKTGMEKETELNVSCQLYSPPLVQVMPAMLPVTVPVTQAQTRPVTIVYNGKGEMKIESYKVANDAIGLSLIADPKGRSHRLDVKIPKDFNPSSDQAIDIVVTTSVETMREIKIPIRPTRMRTPTERPPVAAKPDDLVGKPTPPSYLSSLTGQPLQIGSSGGQVTVVNFWASRSGLSRQQLPVIQSLSNLYVRKGVSFININVDPLRPANEIREMLTQIGVFPGSVAADPRMTTAARFGLRSVPTLFLIGRGGIVEAVHEGFDASQEPVAYSQMLRRELDLLLDGRTRTDFPAVSKAVPKTDVLDGQMVPPMGTPSPRLRVESLRQDVGIYKPGGQGTEKVYLRNEGMQPLTISSVTGSPGLTVQAGYSTTLQPSSTTAVTCQFAAGTQPGPFSHQLTINSNDPARPKLDITLLGAVRSYLEVDPKTGIDFGRNPRTQTMGRMATVNYNGTGEVNYLSAESSSPKFEATVEKLKQGQNAKLVVNPKPPFEIGEHKATITVKTSCKEQATLEVPVSLYSPKRIEVEPAAVVVGGPDRVLKYSVAITNNTMDSLTILGVQSTNRGIRWQFYPEPDGFSYKLELTLPPSFSPAAGGDQITIRTDDKEFGEIVIPIKTGA